VLFFLLYTFFLPDFVVSNWKRRSRAMRPPKHNPTKPHCFLTQCTSNLEASCTNVPEETQYTWRPGQRALSTATSTAMQCLRPLRCLGVVITPFSDQFRNIQLVVTFLSHRCNSRTDLGEVKVESHASSETRPCQAALLLDTQLLYPGN
uniref:Uncharacterized protein n=1 Tax=Salmo trutta TaxID=8032 RepID=A0A673VZZ3_SALTR